MGGLFRCLLLSGRSSRWHYLFERVLPVGDFAILIPHRIAGHLVLEREDVVKHGLHFVDELDDHWVVGNYFPKVERRLVFKVLFGERHQLVLPNEPQDVDRFEGEGLEH